jgi:hypothetical protein
LGSARRNAFGDDCRTRVTPDMNHLCARVGLLQVVGDGNRVEFAD